MRRLFIYLLTICVTFSILVTPAHAAENSTSEREQLIHLACDVFPEYASILRGEDNSYLINTRSISEPTVVYSETRSVSENCELMYTQYSNGRATATQFTYTEVDRSAEVGAGIITTTLTIKVACTDSPGVFTLSNIQYSISQSTYDFFVGEGSPAANSTCQYFRETGNYAYVKRETASGPAYIEYHLTFKEYGATTWFNSFQVIFRISLRNNKMNITLTPK